MKINNKKIKSLFLLSLVGSDLSKEVNAKNQSKIASDGINLNSLPQLVANLTERENNPDQTLFFAGMPIFFRDSVSGNDQGRCVSNFFIVPTEANDPSSCLWGDGVILLTSALCCKDSICDSYSEDDPPSAFLVSDNPQRIGNLWDTTFNNLNDNNSGNDFAAVGTGELGTQPIPYVMGEKGLYPVTGLGSAATVGTKVCAYGPIAGRLCGNIVEMNLSIWSGRSNMRGGTNWGINFDGVNKVDLGDYGFYNEEDLGGPVYVESNIGDRTIAQALGHITSFDNNDQHHKFIYYTPLDKVLNTLTTEQDCQYTLMTYNEANDQEYQQLLTQVEIPTKK